MPENFKMPKSGIFDARGRLHKAGHKFLTGIESSVNTRNQGVADTAEKFLVPSRNVVQTGGMWETMAAEAESGADLFTPDIGSRLHFDFTLTGATEMQFPLNAPEDHSAYFSVLFRQDGTGGRILTFADGYVGEAVEILDQANDRTLCGFLVLSSSEITGWAIKGIAA